MLDLGRAAPPHPHDGRSVVPVLRPRPRLAVPVLTEGLETSARVPRRGRPPGARLHDARTTIGLRTPRWKYVRYVDGDGELYDLDADANELHNRFGDPAYAAVQAELEQVWAAHKDCRRRGLLGTAAGPPRGGPRPAAGRRPRPSPGRSRHATATPAEPRRRRGGPGHEGSRRTFAAPSRLEKKPHLMPPSPASAPSPWRRLRKPVVAGLGVALLATGIGRACRPTRPASAAARRDAPRRHPRSWCRRTRRRRRPPAGPTSSRSSPTTCAPTTCAGCRTSAQLVEDQGLDFRNSFAPTRSARRPAARCSPASTPTTPACSRSTRRTTTGPSTTARRSPRR